ncbi:MAG: exo-alpha-sialidase [Ruminococcaceae bacterium]|nr:exo-alpha-sialidase [Oscillospiraceae bacterium]
MRKFISLFLAVICALLSLLIFASCQKKEEEKIPADIGLNISEYTIIRSDTSSKDITNATKTFKQAIKSFTGAELTVETDYVRRDQTVDESKAEILVGSTNRTATNDAKALLDEAEGDNFIIRFVGNKIIILGNDDKATMHALKYFIVNYVSNSASDNTFAITGEFVKIESYNSEITILSSLTTVEIPVTSVVEKNLLRWSTYGRVIELKHNGENNGILFATSQWAGSSFPLYRSDDGGVTWKLINTVEEQLDPNVTGNWQPHLYELPCQVGEMPKGTLLLSGCSHNEEKNISKMCIWRSYDLGETWEEYCVVDTGGNPTNGGVWEPFLICDEDGSLVCFYSDEMETTKENGQRLVLRVSKDGVNWGEEKYCVAPYDKSLRPGMVSVAKMGDHGYLIVYEMIGQQMGPVYYKVSKSLTEWKDYESLGKKITTSSGDFTGCTPYCEWTPAGGPYGTVIAAGRHGDLSGVAGSKLFLSFDLGETWQSIENPLPYDYKDKIDPGCNYAYSFGFFAASDGTIFYINDVFPGHESQNYKYMCLKFAKIKLDGYASYQTDKTN